MSVRFRYLSGHLQYNNEEQLVLGLGHDIKTIGDENATNLLVFNVLFKVKIITVGFLPTLLSKVVAFYRI